MAVMLSDAGSSEANAYMILKSGFPVILVGKPLTVRPSRTEMHLQAER